MDVNTTDILTGVGLVLSGAISGFLARKKKEDNDDAGKEKPPQKSLTHCEDHAIRLALLEQRADAMERRERDRENLLHKVELTVAKIEAIMEE